MKQALIFCLAALGFLTTNAQKGKRVYLNKGADGGCMIVPGSVAFEPGDTLVLRASQNPWSYVFVGGLKGTKAKPIYITNEGVVEFSTGISMENAEHVHWAGNGGKEKFGFFIHNSKGSAVSISGKSAHIEVDHFQVKNATFGVWAKNEATCDTSINNWIMDYLSIHDYRMENIRIEGFYMGSTDPDNSSRPINCNGEQKFYKTTRLGHVKVYNGYINGTGRPAIMLCGAMYGLSEIYNNTIINAGREYSDQQGTGISIGMYTRAYIHHNNIKNTFTWGIASLGGSGMVRIENNTIDSSGHLDGREARWAQNIFVDTRRTAPTDSTTFIIKNNKLSTPGRDADHIYVDHTIQSYTRRGNEICNNGKSASVKVKAGVYWKKCGSEQVASASMSRKTKLWLFSGLALTGGAWLVYYLRSKYTLSIKKASI